MEADTVNITKIIALRKGGSCGVPEGKDFESSQNAQAPYDMRDRNGIGRGLGLSHRTQHSRTLGLITNTHLSPPLLEIKRHWAI